MATVDLGKLRLAWRGDYLNTTAYERLDMVRFERDLYICISTPGAAGTAPSDAQHWALMVERNGFFWRGAWDATAAYKRNDAVFHGRSAYFCVADAPPGTLPTDTGFWTLIAEGTSITVDPGDLIFRDADNVEKRLPVGTVGQALIVQANGMPGYGAIDLRKREHYAQPITPPPFTSPTQGVFIGEPTHRAAVGVPSVFWESHGHSQQYIKYNQTQEMTSGGWSSWTTSGSQYAPNNIIGVNVDEYPRGFPQYDNWYYLTCPTQSQNHGQRSGHWMNAYNGTLYDFRVTRGVHNRIFINMCTGSGWWWGVFPFLLDPTTFHIAKRLPAISPMTWSNSYPTCSLQLTPFGQMQYSQNTGNIWTHFDLHKDLVDQYSDSWGNIYFGFAVHANSTDTAYCRMAGFAVAPVYDPGYVSEGYAIYYGLNGWYQNEWVWWGHTANQFAGVQCEGNRYPGNTVRYLTVPVFDKTKDLVITLMALNNASTSGTSYQCYGEPSMQMIPMHPNTGAFNSYKYIARAGRFKSGPTQEQLLGWGAALQPFQYIVPKDVVQECLGYGGHGVDDVIRLQCSTYCGASGFIMAGYWAQPLEV